MRDSGRYCLVILMEGCLDLDYIQQHNPVLPHGAISCSNSPLKKKQTLSASNIIVKYHDTDNYKKKSAHRESYTTQDNTASFICTKDNTASFRSFRHSSTSTARDYPVNRINKTSNCRCITNIFTVRHSHWRGIQTILACRMIKASDPFHLRCLSSKYMHALTVVSQS